MKDETAKGVFDNLKTYNWEQTDDRAKLIKAVRDWLYTDESVQKPHKDYYQPLYVIIDRLFSDVHGIWQLKLIAMVNDLLQKDGQFLPRPGDDLECVIAKRCKENIEKLPSDGEDRKIWSLQPIDQKEYVEKLWNAVTYGKTKPAAKDMSVIVEDKEPPEKNKKQAAQGTAPADRTIQQQELPPEMTDRYSLIWRRLDSSRKVVGGIAIVLILMALSSLFTAGMMGRKIQQKDNEIAKLQIQIEELQTQVPQEESEETQDDGQADENTEETPAVEETERAVGSAE